MPKKFAGENSKAVVAKARKSAAVAEENAKKEKILEDEYWRDDDKQINRKKERKEQQEKKKMEQSQKKAELKSLVEQEEAALKQVAKQPLAKITKAQILLEAEKRNAAIAAAAAAENKREAATHVEKPLVENVNRIEDDAIEARGITEAIAILKTNDVSEDKHPERRIKAAFAAYESANMKRIKEENPTLRLSQLNQILRKEWQKSPDNPLNQMIKVNSEANAHRIAVVESCFGSSGQTLAVPGRVLVGEGVLTKMCRKRGKLRQFFLFNDILVYGNIVINKKKYNKQHVIPLEEVKLESLPDNDQHKNGWIIHTTTKSFAVYAATPLEKEEWVAHINKCVGDLIRKSGKKPSEEHAAVWVPDTAADVCMHCKRTQFTLITRRHHCRKCGAVVCGPCSSKKFLLSQSTKPLRVCINCYETLCKSKSNLNSSNDSFGKDSKDRSRMGDSSGSDSDDDDEMGKPGDASHDQPKFYEDVPDSPNQK